MASGPITSWQVDAKNGNGDRFIFLGSSITVDGDGSHEIKRHLLLQRKVMTNLDCILKSRDITLPTKVRLVKAMVFPVVVYGCESCTVKKAEELMLLNCGVGEDSWEFLGLQGNPKNWCFWTVSTRELMLLDCCVGEDSWESLGLQGEPTCLS